MLVLLLMAGPLSEWVAQQKPKTPPRRQNRLPPISMRPCAFHQQANALRLDRSNLGDGHDKYWDHETGHNDRKDGNRRERHCRKGNCRYESSNHAAGMETDRWARPGNSVTKAG